MPLTLPSPRKTLQHAPLKQDSFSTFGTVVETPNYHPQHLECPPPNPAVVLANQNTAIKQIDVSLMRNDYAQSPTQTPGKAIINMFSCFPRTLTHSQPEETPPVFQIRILERHPFTSQTFIPMGLDAADQSTKYLVIVAPTLPPTSNFPDQGPPDLANVRAFLADGGQAVTYGAGTWHAPMVVVGARRVDFVVVQFSNGVAAEDCQEVEIEGHVLGVFVELDLAYNVQVSYSFCHLVRNVDDSWKAIRHAAVYETLNCIARVLVL